MINRISRRRFWGVLLMAVATLAVNLIGSVNYPKRLAAGYYHTIGLKLDGTVLAAGWNNYSQCNVSSWTDITQVAAGWYNTFGLKTDGTVIAAGENGSGQCNIGSWNNITQIAGGGSHTVGLTDNNTVLAVGYNSYGQCNVSPWTGIVQVAAGNLHTVGLKSDGTVVAIGDNRYGQCNVGSWTGITQIAAGAYHTVGLKANGTVVAIGNNPSFSYGQIDVGSWTSIIQVHAAAYHTVGLKSNGTVVAVGRNDSGQINNLGSWSGINQIVSGGTHTIGLKTDGTVVAVGANSNGQCNVGSWNLGSTITTSVQITEIHPTLSPSLEEVESNATIYRFYSLTNQSSVPVPEQPVSITLNDNPDKLPATAYTANLGANGVLAVGINNALNTGALDSISTLSFPTTMKINSVSIPISLAPSSFQIKKIASSYTRDFTLFAKGSAGVSGGAGALASFGVGKVSLQLAKLSLSGEGGFGINFELDRNGEITKMWRQFAMGLKAGISIPAIEANVLDVIKAKASIDASVALKSQFSNTIDLTKFSSTQKKVVAAGFLIESFTNSGLTFDVTTRLLLRAINYWLDKNYGTLLDQARYSESYGTGIEGGLGANASVGTDEYGVKANASVTGSFLTKSTIYKQEASKARSIEMGYVIDGSINFSEQLVPDFFELTRLGVGLQESNSYSMKWKYDANTGMGKEFSFKMDPSQNASLSVDVFKSSLYTSYPSEFKFTDAEILSQFKLANGSSSKILSAGVLGNYLGLDAVSIVSDLVNSLQLAKTISSSQQVVGFEKTTGINRGKVHNINAKISLGAGLGLTFELKIGLSASYTQEASQDLFKSYYYKSGYYLRKQLTDLNIQPSENFLNTVLVNNVFAGLTTIINDQINALKDEIAKVVATANEVINLVENGTKTIGTLITNNIPGFKIVTTIFSSKLESLVGGKDSSLGFAKFETPYLESNMTRDAQGKMVLSKSASTILSIVSKSFIIEAQNGSGANTATFPSPQTLALQIEETDLNESGFSLADAAQVKLYRYDPATEVWSSIAGGINNGSSVTASISSTGVYALGIEITVDLSSDPDGDGLTIAQEDANGNGLLDQNETDPYNPDTDGDGYMDGFEVTNGSDPLNVNSIPSKYRLTLHNPVGGVLEPQAGTSDYLAGTKVELIARNMPGYAFVGWSGDIASTENPVTITMNSDKTIQANFILTQQLFVDHPTSTSLWEKGKTYSITWLTQGTQNAYVKIQLLKGTSTLVSTLTAKTANDGSFDWKVPTTLAVGNTYFIRVQTIDNLIKDDSDKFSIIVPTITVTAPTTGTVWVKAATKTIAWNKSGTQDANVKIQLFMGTTKKLDIALSAPNNGIYDWPVPSTLANGNYTIRITTLDGKVKGTSKVFSIATGMIKVTAPIAAAKWFRGMPYDITWASEGAVNANVKIQLYKGTTKVLDISPSIPTAAGIFNWTVPAAQAVATTYSIKITALDNLVSGKSGSFAIQPGAMAVTAPTAGAAWQRGLPHIITWTKEGDLINANVKIQLFKGTTLVSTIAATTPNDGSHEWVIPAAQALATTYKIRVTTVDNLVKADSGTFAISSSVGLTLTAPNGNEILKAEQLYLIRWTDDPNVMEVQLEFSRDNGGTYTTIADHIEDSGKYDWLVPVNFTRNGIVRISDASGKPWLNDGLLEFSLKFIYSGEGDEPGAVLWFGGSDPKDPGYEFAKIGIGRTQVQFGGLSKAIEPLAGNWHELRVRFDFRRDTAEIKLDDQPLFENAPLGTTRERYFQPSLALQTGGDNGVDFMMDDLNISVVQLDDLGNEKEMFNALNDNFDRYDETSNALQNCWQGLNAIDKESKVELSADSPASQSLRLCTEAGKRLMIYLPFSLPDRVPFDISDRCFNIVN